MNIKYTNVNKQMRKEALPYSRWPSSSRRNYGLRKSSVDTNISGCKFYDLKVPPHKLFITKRKTVNVAWRNPGHATLTKSLKLTLHDVTF